MNKIKSIILLLALAVTLFFSACKMNINSNEETENTPRFVTIYPVVNIDGSNDRTIMPDLSGITPQDLIYRVTCGYMDGSWSQSNPQSDDTAYYKAYQTFIDGFEAPEGNIYIEVQGYIYRNSKYYYFIGRKENLDVTYGQNISVSFNLYPKESTNYSVSTSYTLDFDFPNGTNPTVSSAKVMAYHTNGNIYDNSSIASNKIVTSVVPASPSEGILEHTHIQITDSRTLYRQYDYYVEIVFENKEEIEGVETTTGIYKYKSPILYTNAGVVSETVNVTKFAQVYTVTYHKSNGSTSTDTYSPAYGFELLEPATYTWFTDETCTIKATGLAGSCTGNIDLYSSVATNKYDLYLCDMDGNPIAIKTTEETPVELTCAPIPNKNYAYIYRGDDERLESNGVKYNISKEGYYIKAVYYDMDRNSTFCSSTSGYGKTNKYFSADGTLYVEYAPIVKVKVVDFTHPETVLKEMKVYSGSYKLYDTYMKDANIGDNKSYSDDVYIYKYYSSLEDSDSVIAKETSIAVVEAETVIYGLIDVPYTLTVIDIDAEDKTSEEAILKEYTFNWHTVTLDYDKLSTIRGSDYVFGYYIDYYSYDESGNDRIYNGSTLTDLPNDLTIYAKKNTPHTLSVVEMSDVSTELWNYTITVNYVKVSGSKVSFHDGTEKTVSGDNLFGLYRKNKEGVYQRLSDNVEYKDFDQNTTLYVRRYTTSEDETLIKNTAATIDAWSSTTGIYSYEVLEDEVYNVKVYDYSGTDNYFYIFVNGECVGNADSDSQETVVSVNAGIGDIISIKHCPYSGKDSLKNLNPISGYSKESSDYIKLYKTSSVLESFPTSE